MNRYQICGCNAALLLHDSEESLQGAPGLVEVPGPGPAPLPQQLPGGRGHGALQHAVHLGVLRDRDVLWKM